MKYYYYAFLLVLLVFSSCKKEETIHDLNIDLLEIKYHLKKVTGKKATHYFRDIASFERYLDSMDNSQGKKKVLKKEKVKILSRQKTSTAFGTVYTSFQVNNFDYAITADFDITYEDGRDEHGWVNPVFGGLYVTMFRPFEEGSHLEHYTSSPGVNASNLGKWIKMDFTTSQTLVYQIQNEPYQFEETFHTDWSIDFNADIGHPDYIYWYSYQ